MNRRTRALVVVAGVCAAAVVAVAITFQRDVKEAYAALGESQLIQTPCGSIEYAMAGTGPAVLVVHGAGGGFDQGLMIGAPLVQAGYTVIAPSRFGYLRTPAPAEPTPAAQADAHVCLLDALNVDKVAAMGVSAGSPSAAQLCLAHPERCSALILAVPALFTPGPAAREARRTEFALFLIETTLRSEFLFWLARHVLRDAMVESVLATPRAVVDRATPAERERVEEVFRAIAPIQPRADGLMIDATVTTVAAEHPYEQIAAPTLLISARDDGYGTAAAAEQLARRIPRTTLLIFEDGGHLWVGHQRELWQLVEQFLQTHTGAEPMTRA